MKSPLSRSIAAALVLAASPAFSQEKVTFNDHILPIFRNACLNCHNPDKKKAGLDLSTYQATLQGSENGKIVESGNAGNSLLFKCVKQTEDPKMPPKGDKLSDAELAIVEKWIAGQLLETATGKAVAASNNNVKLAIVSLSKPDGPPPMPGDLPLEPAVKVTRKNALTALAVSPWAPLVAIGGQKQIVLYNTETLEPLGVLPFPEGFPTVIRFSRNGEVLMTAGGLGGKSGKVVLWDVKTGDRIATLGNEFDQVLGADISPDHQFVAIGGPNKLVKMYSTKDGKLFHSEKKHTDWVTAVSYSPDGKIFASADRNGGIMLWEGNTGKEYNSLPGHKAMVTSLAFMPGVLASASEDGKISLWDVKEAKEIKSWTAHAGGAAWVDFTPDGRIVSAGRDKIAKVWDQTGQLIGKSDEFGDIALRAVLANDRVIAGDWNGDIHVCTLGAKRVGELSANPTPITDRLADATKRLADGEAAAPGLQKALADADAALKAEKAAAEAAKKAETDAWEAAKNLPTQIEARIAEERKQLEELRKAAAAAADPDKAAAQQKVEAQVAKLKQSEADIAAARQAFQAKVDAQAKAKAARVQEATQKVQALNAETEKLRAARNSIKAGTPEYAVADAKIQAKKQEITQAQAVVEAIKNDQPVPVTQPSATETALAKAKEALEQNTAQIAAAKTEIGKWNRAQAFMNVHRAKESLAEKQARYEGLVATAKDALLPADGVRNDIATTEKAVAEAPAKIKEKEAAVAKAQAALEPFNKAIAAAEAALAEKEKAAATAAADAEKIAAAPEELRKKIEAATAETEKLRQARAQQKEGTPEFADADAKVQAKKAEIAEMTTAMNDAKAKIEPAKKQAEAMKPEIAKAREAVEKAHAELKNATVDVTMAEKALADAKKSAEQLTQKLAKLRADAPTIVQNAKAAKVKAEADAVIAQKELEAAKATAEKARAEYQARWGATEKAASAAGSPAPVAKN